MEGVNGAEWKDSPKPFSGSVAGSKGTTIPCAGLRLTPSLFAATGTAVTKTLTSFVLVPLFGLLALILPALRAEAQTLSGPVVTQTRLPPSSLTNLSRTPPRSLPALNTKHQTLTP